MKTVKLLIIYRQDPWVINSAHRYRGKNADNRFIKHLFQIRPLRCHLPFFHDRILIPYSVWFVGWKRRKLLHRSSTSLASQWSAAVFRRITWHARAGSNGCQSQVADQSISCIRTLEHQHDLMMCFKQHQLVKWWMNAGKSSLRWCLCCHVPKTSLTTL